MAIAVPGRKQQSFQSCFGALEQPSFLTELRVSNTVPPESTEGGDRVCGAPVVSGSVGYLLLIGEAVDRGGFRRGALRRLGLLRGVLPRPRCDVQAEETGNIIRGLLPLRIRNCGRNK